MCKVGKNTKITRQRENDGGIWLIVTTKTDNRPLRKRPQFPKRLEEARDKVKEAMKMGYPPSYIDSLVSELNLNIKDKKGSLLNLAEF